MKVLVLGGSQFIGRALVRALLAAGHDVSVFNRGQTPTEFPDEVRRLYGDRKDAAAVRTALSGQDWDAVYDNSGYVAEDVAAVLDALDGRVGHLIFTSTASVYDRRWTAPVLEDHPYNEIEGGPYAAGKIAAEKLLFAAHRERGLPVSIIRPAMVFGPANNSAGREVLYFLRAERGRTFMVPYNGYIHLQYGHVDDLAAAFVQMTGVARTFGEAYNITSADAITINGYLATIARLTGRDITVAPLHWPEMFATAAAGRDVLPFSWQYSRIASIGKAEEHFGFRPRFNSVRYTEDTFAWYKAQGLDQQEYDYAAEDSLLATYGGDPSYWYTITAEGEMPQPNTVARRTVEGR
ncbi:MAG: NAD-dependent epimerase/dehydratase family protein [Chloroflexi bacterium]|nr:NAD-dependent epimerase/dehydratase family protein [Chloroflexota bacterium]